jgi:zinc protease
MKPTTLIALFLLAASAAGAIAEKPSAPVRADRSRPPAPAEPEPYRAEVPERFALSNGLPVLLVSRPGVPLVDIAVQLRAGASDDRRGREGTASLTSALITEGAGKRGALDLHEATSFLGADLSADAGWEGTRVQLHVPKPRLDEGAALLADVVLRPSFPAEEYKRLQESRRTQFLQWQDSPMVLSQLARDRALWGEHRYALPRGGTPTALEKVTREDLVAFHAAHFAPDNAFVVVAGDVTRDEVRALLERHLGQWQRKAKKPARALAPPEPPVAGARVLLVDKPGAPQSVIAAVARAPKGLLPLDPHADVMNTLLGGSFTSRLNQNLREDKGYSYGARSGFELKDLGNAFVAYSSVATPVTGPAAKEVLKELGLIRSYVEDTEARRARRYLALTYPSGFESTRSVASFWAWAEAEAVSPARVASYPADVLAVREGDVLQAALTHVEASEVRLVVVGDKAQVLEGLEALGLGPVTVYSVPALLEATR